MKEVIMSTILLLSTVLIITVCRTDIIDLVIDGVYEMENEFNAIIYATS